MATLLVFITLPGLKEIISLLKLRLSVQPVGSKLWKRKLDVFKNQSRRIHQRVDWLDAVAAAAVVGPTAAAVVVGVGQALQLRHRRNRHQN